MSQKEDNRESRKLRDSHAAKIVRILREEGPKTTKELHARLSTGKSDKTLRRALEHLRNTLDAPIVSEKGVWKLTDPSFSLALDDPTAEDLVALALACTLLERLGDSALSDRAMTLLEQLDERAKGSSSRQPIRPSTLSSTWSVQASCDASVLTHLVQATKRAVVQLDYRSPWNDPPVTKEHTFEPWHVRVHNGDVYVRGWNPAKSSVMTLNVASILRIRTMSTTSTKRADAEKNWNGEEHGMLSVARDTPGHATVILRGGMARYQALRTWSSDQVDAWLEPDQRLERRFGYSSTREAARLLLSLGDSVERIEPEQLRDEVLRHAKAMLEKL